MADERPRSPTGQYLSAERGDRPQTRDEEQVRAEPRAERLGLGSTQPKMTLPRREGFHRRWVNDTPGRVRFALSQDWSHIEDPDELSEDGRGIKKFMTVGVKEDGAPLTAYAMEIPMELYEQDQKRKQAPLDAFDEQLKRGIISGADAQDNVGDFYVPSEGITLRRD